VAAANLKGKAGMVGWVVVTALIAAAFGLAFNLKGCDETTSREIQPVKLSGRTFFLEIAADPDVRMKGLGGRTEIADDGGMLFVFSRLQDKTSGFVMRDCPVDIDIIYLDAGGHIVGMHEMKAEEPRGPGEGSAATFDRQNDPENERYEKRLTIYKSRYPYQFAIELKGGTLPDLKLQEGQKVVLPYDKLKAMAR
jgi:uncharacterized membrane protein (UPF0127 family)